MGHRTGVCFEKIIRQFVLIRNDQFRIKIRTIINKGKIMGQELDIDIHIGSEEFVESEFEKYVDQAENIVADMIKLYYLDSISTSQSKYEVFDTFLRKREMLRAYPESQLLDEYPDCALKRLSSSGNDIHITQCSDLQRTLPPADSDRSGFLYDVCIAIWRELPTVPMNAESRLTMTDTDLVEKTEVRYTGEELIVTKTSYSLNHDDDCLQNSATWKMLPRCIAVNGKAL